MKATKPKRTKPTRMAPAAADVIGQTPEPQRAVSEADKAVVLAPIEQLTEIKAKADVGWGNTVFIRGQGDGLSWEKGSPLVCSDSSTWIWSTRRASANIIFKLLLNDQIWAAGADAVVEPGQRLEIVPTFECSGG